MLLFVESYGGVNVQKAGFSDGFGQAELPADLLIDFDVFWPRRAGIRDQLNPMSERKRLVRGRRTNRGRLGPDSVRTCTRGGKKERAHHAQP